jgi:MoxR-like ATPase
MNTALAQKLRQIRTELRSTFIQRDAAIDAMLLAVMAKEHCYILGPPGTGKSDMTRAFILRLIGATYFEVAVSKTLPEAALLGQIDIKRLRDTGESLRKRDGYLTTVNFAFIDEAGKMSAILGHHLLAALNERVRHEVENGVSHHPIPLYTAITASNELLVRESEDAAALWDRLLVRTTVDYINDTAGFVSLLKRGAAPATTVTTVDFAELADAIDNEVPAVVLSDATIDGVLQIRKGIAAAHIVVSDRRWRQAMKVIRAHAWLDGRDTTTLADLAALDYVLWQTPDQIDTVRRIRVAVADPLARDAMAIRDTLAEITAELNSRRNDDKDTRLNIGRGAARKRRQATREIEILQKAYADAGLDGTDQVLQLKDAIDALEDLITQFALGE